MSDETTPKISLDISSILDVAHLGARRASAFVTIGRTRSGIPELLTDFSLGNTHKHSFWPSPVPLEAAKAAVDEFDSWIIGSALRELHTYFEMFLNATWNFAYAVNLHGTKLPSNYVLEDKSFRDITSVRRKLEKLSEILKVDAYWLICLNSMHFARNCLTHGAGYVRERDCTENNYLRIEWSGMDAYIMDGDERIQIEDAIERAYEVKSKDGATVIVELVKRARLIKTGEKVTFENHELAEICTFYTTIAGLIIQSLLVLFKIKGIPIKETMTVQPTNS